MFAHFATEIFRIVFEMIKIGFVGKLVFYIVVSGDKFSGAFFRFFNNILH